MKPSAIDIPIGVGAVWIWAADLAQYTTTWLTLLAAIGGVILVWARVCLTIHELRNRKK